MSLARSMHYISLIAHKQIGSTQRKVEEKASASRETHSPPQSNFDLVLADRAVLIAFGCRLDPC
jgi:hypothetical protein